MPPSDESPLYYDVVGVWAPGVSDTVALERVMLRELDRLRGAIAEGTEGHLIQVFLYANPTGEVGDGQDIAQLTYRGWRREAHMRFPQAEDALVAEPLPEAESYPAAIEDPRLEAVLAAFDDIWFLATPRQGLEFTARLLVDLFDDAHVMFGGLGRATDDFRLGAVHGQLPGWEAPRHIPDRGLVSLALKAAGKPVVLPDPTADPRVELPAEGVHTGPLMAAAAVHGGTPLAYVRIARRKGGAQFRLVDADVLRAALDRLGLFLRLRGATLID